MASLQCNEYTALSIDMSVHAVHTMCKVLLHNILNACGDFSHAVLYANKHTMHVWVCVCLCICVCEWGENIYRSTCQTAHYMTSLTVYKYSTCYDVLTKCNTFLMKTRTGNREAIDIRHNVQCSCTNTLYSACVYTQALYKPCQIPYIVLVYIHN